MYVDDLERSADFYQTIFQFKTLTFDEKVCALNVAAHQVVLLFRKGSAREPVETRGGTIPAHDGSGELHLAFSIPEAELEGWKHWLAENSIALESEVTWLRGGRSIYFRDPDHHLIELITPGTWSIY